MKQFFAVKYMQLNSKHAAHLILSVVGICSLSLPFAQAAQAREVDSLCGDNNITFVAAETKHFLVSICGGETANTYRGLDKKAGKYISLPLSDNGQSNGGRYFEAVNDEYTYRVNVSVRNQSLVVKRNKHVILNEAIIAGLH
ncbi:hypothetical protein NIES2101_10360 [Calothrix sp. HK-06]|nr:hypothetical protein NIES2101_10360 [Calothrix sp. HK-06]